MALASDESESAQRLWFPNEIITQIVEQYLKDERTTLLSCCLVSRTWYQISYPCLFHKISISVSRNNPLSDTRSMDNVLEFFTTHPHLAASIKVLTLHDKTRTTRGWRWTVEGDVLLRILTALPGLRDLTLYNILPRSPVDAARLQDADVVRPSVRELTVIVPALHTYGSGPPSDILASVLALFTNIGTLAINMPIQPYIGQPAYVYLATPQVVPKVLGLTLSRAGTRFFATAATDGRSMLARFPWLSSVRTIKAAYFDRIDVEYTRALIGSATALEHLEVVHAAYENIINHDIAMYNFAACTRLRTIHASTRLSQADRFGGIMNALVEMLIRPMLSSWDIGAARSNSVARPPMRFSASFNVQDCLQSSQFENLLMHVQNRASTRRIAEVLKQGVKSGCIREVIFSLHAKDAAEEFEVALGVLKDALLAVMPELAEMGVLNVN